jgi:hypothetical protein
MKPGIIKTVIATAELEFFAETKKRLAEVPVPTRLFAHAVFDGHDDPGHPHGQWSVAFDLTNKDDSGKAKAEMCFLMGDIAPEQRLKEIGNGFTIYYGSYKVGRGKLTGILDDGQGPRKASD